MRPKLTHSSSSTTRRVVLALLSAIALVFISNVSTTVRAQSPTAQPFPSTFERELWRELPIWENLQHNKPSHVFIEEDDARHSAFYMDADPFASEFAALSLGECTFSQFGDFDSDIHTGWDVPMHRVCKGPAGSEVPPAPGAQLLPVSVAVDSYNPGTGMQHRVYVLDLFNHRVQVFDFDGNVIKLPFEIGMGRFGRGHYTMPAGPGYPSGAVGELLNMPYAVTVDASHRILVADGGNGRIAVFNPDGSFAFEFNLPLRPTGLGPEAGSIRPYEVTLSPGASVIDPASAGVPSADGRIIVSDWGRCFVYSFDTKFNLKGDLPNAIPADPQHAACVNPESPSHPATAPYEFSGITGIAVDALGHVYVADPAQRTLQVFDRDLNHIGWIGRPGFEPNPDAWLEGPVGVAIDHLGRIGVVDGGSARVMFYTVTFGGPADPPVANFEFALKTTLSVQDFNMGLVEQWGTGPGLDEKGRYVATDPLNRRILRFELPELGIANAVANEGIGTFDVAVPSQKLGDVLNVVVDVQPVEPGVVITSPPTPSTPITIGPGKYVTYTFAYSSLLGQSTFHISATGSTAEGPVEADPVDAVARKSCAPGCAAEHQIYADPPPVPTPISPAFEDWYGQEVFVRITPQAGSAPFNSVHYYFEGAVAQQQEGADEENVASMAAGFVDVRVRVNGVSKLWYWPVTVDGEAGDPTGVDLSLDLNAPHLNFSGWTTPAGIAPNGTPWYRTDATGTYVVEDSDSGAVTETGSITITGQGANLFRTFPVYDNVGHFETVHTANAGGGRWINIDRTAPVVTPPINLQVVAGLNGLATVPASFGTGGTATDALSGVSGVVTGTGPATVANGQSITWTFTARDVAGNIGTATATVTAVPSALRYTGSNLAEYGHDLPVAAVIEPAGTGAMRFTLLDASGRGSRTVTVPTVGGVATASLLTIVNNVGTYDVRVEYLGTDITPTPAALTVRVTITPTPISIIAHPNQSKFYGKTEPGLTYHVSGILYHPSDVFTGNLVRVAGENVALYNIGQGTVAINANYTIAYTADKFSVKATEILIKANDASRIFGVANPSFGAVVTGDLGPAALNYTVTTAATQFSNVVSGGYPITVNPGSNPNYDVSVQNGTLTITKRVVNVVGATQVILLGAVEPTLGYTVEATTATTGLVNGNSITGSLVRAAGTGLGDFATANNGPTPLTAGNNYTLNFVPGVLRIVTNLPGNTAPVATNDTATTSGAAPVDISVLTNDTDANGDALTITSVTQPATGGTVTISGTKVKFTPTPGFTGAATFTYYISDGKGGVANASVTVTVTGSTTCTTAGFTTYTQGGWGASPNGNNPAMLLQTKFAQVYPGGSVSIGGTKKLTFTSSTAIMNFLPAGGTAGVLTANATNPTSSAAGVLAGQMLAMQLNLDFSNAGVTKAGLGSLEYQGYAVAEIMEAANAVLGGDTSILNSYGIGISDLTAIIDALNQNFDNGTQNLGALTCPAGPTNCGVTQVSLTGTMSSTSGTAGNLRTYTANSVSVKASAFSRAKSNGAWSTAFLGQFGTYGLGVTDGSEGNGADDSHKVDNVGDRLNYILFEFSQPVVVNKAFLDYIGADGDVTVWVGTKSDPYNNHQTLSDAFLTSLGAAQSNTSTSTADRWATFNGGNVTANVLVIAADVTDTTPEDSFKVSKLEFSCGSVPNNAPVVTATNKSNTEADVVSVQLTATDADNDTLTYTATGLPPGLSMSTSGLITGTLGYSAAGTYNVTIRVDDPSAASGTATFVWTVINKNRPPTVTVANRTDNKGTAASGSVSGSDPDGDALTYTATGLPTGVNFSTAGAFSGTFTTAGTFNVTVTVKDSSNATGTGTFTWTVIVPNVAPTITAAARTNAEGNVVSVQFTGTDADGDALTYSATGLPTGLSMSSAGKVTGTLGYTSAGTYNVTVTVKDPGNKTGSATFVWTVTNANRAPDAVSDSATAYKGDSVTISVRGNDSDPDGDTLTITATTAPAKGSVSIQSNGTIKYTAPSNWTGTTTFTYTVKDASGLTDTATVTITVKSHQSNDGCSDHR